MSRQVLRPVWLLATCVLSVQCSLLPYGDTEGHIATPGLDDGSGPSLSLQPPFRFYGTNYSTAFVNNDGSVTFIKAGTFQDTTSDPGNTPAVCGLCTDIDVTVSGTVWYVLSTASALRQTVAEDVRRYQEFPADYTPSWVLLATWADVATFKSEDNKVDTFQITMATDGTASVVILFYERIEWVYDNSDFLALYQGTEPSVRTQSGFLAGDGMKSYLLPGSKSDELINITKLSNVGVAGKFIFRVDSDILPVHLPDTTSQYLLH
ncbi:sushi, nidogen and EGF-like domain-containing protein 1 [Haliotis rufescens]|uniref:sushi, nidogen and EGF-like domain-containing protein 1 n=1 Tax=Haliotis rufescens TaxID=6454 RepID=UPI00201F933C|nr:sushi, nidogen and EGF-like domain-containing protein 1 [Haliotis rufescens]